MPAERDVQHRIEDLPPALLHWLLPSRLCESDRLGDAAWELFGDDAARRRAGAGDLRLDPRERQVRRPERPDDDGRPRSSSARAACAATSRTSASTFCRALGIPARYVFGYLPDIGIPGPFPPMDFHAWFEVWLGDRWWTYDARFNTPRIGRVPIGRGRDAVDVAMVTTYGDASARDDDGLGGRGGRARRRRPPQRESHGR